MKNNKEFKKVVDKNLGKLRQFVPIVNKVHGPKHPEFYKVKDVFDLLNEKILNDELDLNKEFSLLRKTTDNYKVPSDVCESYEAVYSMLEELDSAYNKLEEVVWCKDLFLNIKTK